MERKESFKKGERQKVFLFFAAAHLWRKDEKRKGDAVYGPGRGALPCVWISKRDEGQIREGQKETWTKMLGFWMDECEKRAGGRTHVTTGLLVFLRAVGDGINHELLNGVLR